MRIFSIILRVSLIPLSLISAQSRTKGYFMTRFAEFDKLFLETHPYNDKLSKQMEERPFAKMSLYEKQQICSKFFKTRVFVDDDKYKEEILSITNQINKSEFDIDPKLISTAHFLVLTDNCFFSEHFSFSFSPNYISFNENILYYPYFAYYTHKASNTSTAFAYIEENSVIVEDLEIDKNLYQDIMKNEDLNDEYLLLEKDQNDLFRICSAAATYVLPETSYMEVYKGQTELIYSEDSSELPCIILRYRFNEEYPLYQPLLKCLLSSLTDEEEYETQFYIMLHPVEKNGGYIVQKTKDAFRLKVRLEEVEKDNIFDFISKNQ